MQTGTGKNGTWKKQEFILETPGQISRKICFSLWGDKIDQFNPTEGDETEVSFDLESREYNGRWYTDVKAWKVEPASGGGASSGASQPSRNTNTNYSNSNAGGNSARPSEGEGSQERYVSEDDLPF